MNKKIWIISLLVLLPTLSWSKVYLTQQEALNLAFEKPAKAQEVTIELTDLQRKEIQKKAKSKLDSLSLTYYKGLIENKVIGYAFIDTTLVRSMAATYMVVLDQKGHVKFVELLAFYEPQDYRPSKRWLALFEGKKMGDRIRINKGIRNIIGSTLTTRSIASGVRLMLSIHDVLIKESK